MNRVSSSIPVRSSAQRHFGRGFLRTPSLHTDPAALCYLLESNYGCRDGGDTRPLEPEMIPRGFPLCAPPCWCAWVCMNVCALYTQSHFMWNTRRTPTTNSVMLLSAGWTRGNRLTCCTVFTAKIRFKIWTLKLAKKMRFVTGLHVNKLILYVWFV